MVTNSGELSVEVVGNGLVVWDWSAVERNGDIGLWFELAIEPFHCLPKLPGMFVEGEGVNKIATFLMAAAVDKVGDLGVEVRDVGVIGLGGPERILSSE